MSTMSWPQFTGDPSLDKIQPSAFLRAFRLKCRDSGLDTVGDKVDALADCLGDTESPASVWFEALPNPTKADWDLLQRTFKIQYPDVASAKKTPTEWERELEALRLPEELVGKKEKYRDVDTWSHVVFAQKAQHLATQANIVQSPTGIWKVRDYLPQVLKDKVCETHVDWIAFCTAIRDIPIEKLTDFAKQHEHAEKEKKEQLDRIAKLERALANSRNVPDSPTKALRTGLTSIQLNSPQSPSSNRRYATPARSTSPSPAARRFETSAPEPRRYETLSTEQLAAFRNIVNSLPHHPATEEGKVAYAQQLREWKAKWGPNSKVDHHKPFPLTPGTVAVCSSECYTCGLAGHDFRGCANTPINEKERAWRFLCGRLLGRRAQPFDTQVNLVGDSDDEEDDSWLWPSREGSSQGKGYGPTA